MTMAPPTPMMPATNAPEKLRAASTDRNAAVTPERAPDARRLLQARVVRRDVRERLVGNRPQHGLQLGERGIARTALVRLEEQELVADVARRLSGDGRDQLGRVALTFVAVARHARRRGDAAAIDRRAVGLARRGLALLGGEVRGTLVHAEEFPLLGERLHLGRHAAAR